MTPAPRALAELLAGLDAPPGVVIAPSLRGRARRLLEDVGLDGPFLLLADENTAPVLGERVAAETGGRLLRLVRPTASVELAEAILPEVGEARTVVAVGSGTLNDLAKQVAAQSGRPAAVFATAPSMNGWITATASLARRGLKDSLPVPAPRAAFFDLEVLARAPLRLRRAGLGDALCRTTVETDLELARHLLDTPFPPEVFAAQREVERRVCTHIEGVIAGDPAAVEALVVWLLIQSAAMLRTGSSAVASQGEHAISHMLDDLADPHPDALHGEQVALATFHLARLQAAMLARPEPPRLTPLRLAPADLARVFGRFAPTAEATLRAEGLDDAERVAALAARLETAWETLRARHRETALAPAELARLWERAGLPTRPERLGFDRTLWQHARRFAFLLRPRFGWLDVEALVHPPGT